MNSLPVGFCLRFMLLIHCVIIAFNLQAQTTINGSFVHGGLMRSYRLYIPAIYNPANAVPLVFNLHGYTSNNIQQELYGDFRPVADTANFIIVHPNGTPDGSGNLYWNNFGGSSVDDVGFLSALIDTIKTGYNIDDNCIYSAGMSNGGFMSYDLACFLSNRIAAIASVTGLMIWPRLNTCNPVHPVPVMQIHGTADATVPYGGSGALVPVDSLVRYWAALNNCNMVPVFSAVPDISITDGCTAEKYVFNGGNSGSSVELYKIIGGGHSWPGAPININVTNMDFSASVEIWKFFSKYKLNMLSTLNFHDDNFPVQVFPNPAKGSSTVLFSSEGLKNISVYNATGQLIEHSTTVNRRFYLTFPEMGLFYLVVSDKSGSRAVKSVNLQP